MSVQTEPSSNPVEAMKKACIGATITLGKMRAAVAQEAGAHRLQDELGYD